MDNILHNTQLIDELITISKEAGEAILKVYNSDFDYQIKEDSSPLTKADEISHKIIVNSLNILTPNIPILSEEGANISFETRSKWERYWLIDPLDGTKEFIKRNGEFTVNIALIESGTPILGIIHIPVSKETYWGSKNEGSFYLDGDNSIEKIYTNNEHQNPIRIMASRSHPSKKLHFFLEEIDQYEIFTKGSSLKFCLIACGKADIYPRFTPTSEWDIAAGEAIIRYAGGEVLNINGERLTYNDKENFLNPFFIASSNKILAKKITTIMRKIS